MRDHIVSAAQHLGLTNPTGALKPLDSLNMIDLVVELETRLSISIPSAMLTPDRFSSFETILQMLDELSA